MYFTLGVSPISQLIGFGDTAYRGIGTPFQSPAQNTPPAVSANNMKEAIISIADYLGTDVNTIITVTSTIFVFGFGLIISLIAKHINNVRNKIKHREHFKYLVNRISKDILRQSKEFKKLKESLTLENDIDFTINQRPNPHLTTWNKLDFQIYYESFFGSTLIFNLKKKRIAFNKVFSLITNIINIENIYSKQFYELVDSYNEYQNNWNDASEEILNVFKEILYLPPETEELDSFINDFKIIIDEWQIFRQSKNTKAIHKEILTKLSSLCGTYGNFHQTLTISIALSKIRLAYENLDCLLKVYISLFDVYYLNYKKTSKKLLKNIDLL